MDMLSQEKINETYDATLGMIKLVESGYHFSCNELISLIESFQGCIVHMSNAVKEIQLLKEQNELLNELVQTYREKLSG